MTYPGWGEEPPFPGDAEPAANGTRPLVLAPTLAEVALVSRPPERTYPTGIAQLDRLLNGGWRSRQMALIMGPPGAGKTAIACWAAGLLAETEPILYNSTELESLEIAQRFYASRTETPLDSVVRGDVHPCVVGETLRGLAVRCLGCDELEAVADPLALIEEQALALAALGRPPGVVVDYAQQLVRSEPEGLRVRLGEVARRLRKLAQRIDGPVLAISSTSRSSYGRAARAQAARDTELLGDDPRDMLAAAKESGELEYSAAVVLYLDVGDADESGEYPARLRVAKARRGRTGDAGAVYHGPTGRWYPSPQAVDRLGPEAREAAREARQAERDAQLDASVLAEVRKLQEHRRPTRNDVADALGGKKQRVLAAIRRLIATGDLAEATEKRPDSTGVRVQNHTVLEVGAS